VSARRRTVRDWRRRQFGQNFLDPATADHLVDEAEFTPGELVIDVGAGSGALTRALARRALRVIAVEPDPAWARQLREQVGDKRDVHIVGNDFLAIALPREPFRVIGSLPFGRTTDIFHHLLDDPATCLRRADLIVQWEVALKRAASPPTTLLSTAWAPWWEMRLARRIPAEKFRPVPRVDAGLLTITRRDPPLLPVAMAEPYAAFVKREWPFDKRGA
jgi:23S rRNA (adenine-N6)-dimethyltransferase